MPLPHHHNILQHSPVLCLYLCGDLSPICPSLSLFPNSSRQFCPVAHRDDAEQCFGVYQCSSSIPWCIMTPRPWLALSCSALPPVCFPFTDGVPLSLPSLFAAAFIWSFSPLLVKERHRRRRRRQECQILSCADTLGLFHQTFLFSFLLLLLLLLQFSILAAYNKRWQSMGTNSEVGTLDRYITHGLVAEVCHRWCSRVG